MDFTYRIDVDSDIDTTIEAVTAALKDQGFGVLTRIDVQETLKHKLDVDVEPQVILGACNPHRALDADPRIAALLPCNVVVLTDNGRTVIEAGTMTRPTSHDVTIGNGLQKPAGMCAQRR